MSLAADLMAAFAETGATVPVRLGDAVTRGFLDSAGGMIPLAGTDVQRIGTVLYLRKDSLPGLAENVSVVVGDVGALTADGGRPYRIGPIDPVDDGMIVACPLGGGR